MEVYTIGFTRRSADSFFGALRGAGVGRLLDVRLNNTSQLAGFAKRDDLQFFLRELCGAEYVHEPSLAPAREMLDDYRKARSAWDEYERQYLALLAERRVDETLDRGMFASPTALLCSEPTAERCHRRLALEYLAAAWGGITPIHL